MDVTEAAAIRTTRNSTRASMLTIVLCLLPGAVINECDFPYSPQREPGLYVADTATKKTGLSGSGVIYPVNLLQQSCNPSIVPGGTFAGCMLFLGFDRLSVVVPDLLLTYRTDAVVSHDRLTVVDTANAVRWYLMRDDLEGSGDLQCPEWSTHPDYLVCLVGHIEEPYSGYTVRLSDKKSIKFCDGILEEFSTPHLWVVDSAVAGGTVIDPLYRPDGFLERESLQRFFGTTKVRYVYTLPGKTGTLFLVDYSADSMPVPQPLLKPSGREKWYCASPLISPDGNWLAYHCFPGSTKGSLYSSYIQRLKPGALPRLIADGASDPHWWVDPVTKKYYLIYTATYDDYCTGYDFTDSTVEKKNLAGCTLKQLLSGTTADVPAHMGALDADRSRPPDTLIRLPFKGGLSNDGYYLCTAYKYGYIVRLKEE